VAVYEPACESTSRRVLVVCGKECLDAALHSLSTEGVGLILTRRLDPGIVLGVEMARSSRHFRCMRTLRVWRTTEQPDGTFLTECQFTSPIAYDQLQTLVS
jgi:hypothetical protein